MKVKVNLSTEDGTEWTAEAKDLGLITTGASILSALEEMQEEIQKFFADAFGSNKRIEVLCSKIKGAASITVAPLEEYRPETPLSEFSSEPKTSQDLIEGELLLLSPGEDDIEVEYDDVSTSPAEAGE